MTVLIHQAALGDWALTFPLLRQLAMEGPTIAVAPGEKARLAARLIPGVQAVDIEDRAWSQLHGHGYTAAPPPELTHATRVISFVSNGRDVWATNVRRLCRHGAELAFVEPRPTHAWTSHVCDWHRGQLASQRIRLSHPDPELPNQPRFGFTPAPRQPSGDLARPIVVHPGSGGRHKCWHPDLYVRLVTELRAAGHTVQPILGEAELDTWDEPRIETWRTEHNARTIDTLDALADLLSAARLFIGNDSGPTHVAAQVGLPTIALFGPSNPTHWAPIGPHVTLIEPREPTAMDWLTYDRVNEEVQRTLSH